MSLQSEINRIKTNINAAYSAVSNKGGTIPAEQTIANLPAAINSITTSQEEWNISNGKLGYAYSTTGTIAPNTFLQYSGSTIDVDVINQLPVGDLELDGNDYVIGFAPLVADKSQWGLLIVHNYAYRLARREVVYDAWFYLYIFNYINNSYEYVKQISSSMVQQAGTNPYWHLHRCYQVHFLDDNYWWVQSIVWTEITANKTASSCVCHFTNNSIEISNYSDVNNGVTNFHAENVVHQDEKYNFQVPTYRLPTTYADDFRFVQSDPNNVYIMEWLKNNFISDGTSGLGRWHNRSFTNYPVLNGSDMKMTYNGIVNMTGSSSLSVVPYYSYLRTWTDKTNDEEKVLMDQIYVPADPSQSYKSYLGSYSKRLFAITDSVVAGDICILTNYSGQKIWLTSCYVTRNGQNYFDIGTIDADSAFAEDIGGTYGGLGSTLIAEYPVTQMNLTRFIVVNSTTAVCLLYPNRLIIIKINEDNEISTSYAINNELQYNRYSYNVDHSQPINDGSVILNYTSQDSGTILGNSTTIKQAIINLDHVYKQVDPLEDNDLFAGVNLDVLTPDTPGRIIAFKGDHR